MSTQASEREPATGGGAGLAPERVEAIRASRRHPRRSQFDYLHLRRLVDDLERVLHSIEPPPQAVLDLFCGARPYEDLLPEGARCVGLDVTDEYGRADVVTDEFLPFPDGSFDLILSTEAFYYVPDPAVGLSEIRRVLRPGGTVVLTLPLVWEYDRNVLEHRYTGPELVALFEGWDGVEVVENGGRAVAWATLTGAMLRDLHRGLRRRVPAGPAVDRLFDLVFVLLNAAGAVMERLDRPSQTGSTTLPMNLLVRARRPRT